MTYRDIWQAIKRNYLVFGLTIIIVACGFVGVQYQKTHSSYDTIVGFNLHLLNPIKNTPDADYYTEKTNLDFTKSYRLWLTSDSVVTAIYKTAGIDLDAKNLKKLTKNFQVTNGDDFISLTVRVQGQETAEKLATAIVKVNKSRATVEISKKAANVRYFTAKKPLVKKTASNLPLTLGVGIAAGLILAFIIILVWQYVFNTFESSLSVLKIFKSFKAIHLRDVDHLLKQKEKNNASLNLLRTKLLGAKPPVLTICGVDTDSAWIATNLALNLARSGKKTLLIDANLVERITAEIFPSLKNVGFSEYLADQRENINNFVQSTEFDNLSVIPAGKKIAFPQDLSAGLEITKFINSLLPNYDQIVINTSEIPQNAESFPFIETAQNLALIIKLGKTKYSSVNEINDWFDTGKLTGKFIIFS